MKYADIGSVSHGTMREEDLIPRFCDLLEKLVKENLQGFEDGMFHKDITNHLTAVAAIRQKIKDHDWEDNRYYGTDEAAEDLNEFLFDALNEYAPPLCNFGAHPGDGSDYGFWISEDAQREAEEANIPVVRDGDAVLFLDVNGCPKKLMECGNVVWEV
jgi:hypothetical protein